LEHFNAPLARLFHYLVGDQLPLPTRRLLVTENTPGTPRAAM
jgi:hypothetical protein